MADEMTSLTVYKSEHCSQTVSCNSELKPTSSADTLIICFLSASLFFVGDYDRKSQDVKFEEYAITDLFQKACADAYNELSNDAMLRAQRESTENLDDGKVKHGFVTSGPTMKPAARLVGGPINSWTGRTSRNSRDTTLVQCWCHECANAFLSNGVRYHHGRLIDPNNGNQGRQPFSAETKMADEMTSLTVYKSEHCSQSVSCNSELKPTSSADTLIICFLSASLFFVGDYDRKSQDVKFEEYAITDLFQKACADAYNELSNDAMLRAQRESTENLDDGKVKHGFVTSGPTMKPAARLVEGPINSWTGRTSRNSRDTTLVQCWCHECANAFLSNGVRYHHGRLIVPLTGSYNLYSYVSLRDINYSEKHERLLNGTFFKHAIYRYNVKNGHDVELVSSVQPLLSVNRAFSTPLLRLEHLHAGDEISVKISSIFERHVCTENDFFGLHMI